MIERLAVCVKQRNTNAFGGQWLVRRVGLDEKALQRDAAESLALAGFARVGKIARQGKIGAEFDQAGNEFGRAAVGVQKESAGRARLSLEDFQERPPGLKAMNAHRQPALGGQAELPDEHLLLLRQGVIFDPTIQSNFADR